MKVISVFPKQITAVLEISLDELKKLQKALGMMQINYDGNDKESLDAAEYVSGDFNNIINRIIEQYDSAQE